MTLMNQEKQQLRKIFKEKRSVLTSKEVAEKSSQISSNFIKNLLPKIYEKNFDKVFKFFSRMHKWELIPLGKIKKIS